MIASQINGSAYFRHTHAREARQRGNNQDRRYVLDARRERRACHDRKRAALACTEAVTLVAERRVPADIHHEARRRFSGGEFVELPVAVTAINAWKGIVMSFRAVHPAHQARAA